VKRKQQKLNENKKDEMRIDLLGGVAQ